MQKESINRKVPENGPKPEPIPTTNEELLKLKARGPTTYKVDEGISGSREDNKKMRSQLWGDMVKRSHK